MSKSDNRIHLDNHDLDEELIPITASLLAIIQHKCGGAEVSSISIDNGGGYGCPRGVVHITATLQDAKFSYGKAKERE